MNRKAIRDLASKNWEKTADYRYATTAELRQGVEAVGMPCVVKPLMSSSEKDSPSRQTPTLKAWQYAVEGSRGDVVEVIVEAFVKFN
jgi:phosphoribosylglycinamide formyltransferase 2